MKLDASAVADWFDTVLDGLGHDAVGLRLAVERKLSSIGADGISWRMDTIDEGLFRAMAGQRRDFLVIEHRELREYAVLIGAEPEGSALHVVWMLTAQVRLLNDMKRILSPRIDGESRVQLGAELRLLGSLKLSAFVDLTRLALKHAIRQLTNDDTVANLSRTLGV